MIKYYRAQINWIIPENGGRKRIPPKGTKYAPIIRLSENKDDVWSIVFMCPDFSITNEIVFSFLADADQRIVFEREREYILYEGGKKVADLSNINLF